MATHNLSSPFQTGRLLLVIGVEVKVGQRVAMQKSGGVGAPQYTPTATTATYSKNRKI